MKTVDSSGKIRSADLQGGTPEDVGTVMRNESARWSVVVTQAGIKPE